MRKGLGLVLGAVAATALLSVALVARGSSKVELVGGEPGLGYSQLVSHASFDHRVGGSDYSSDFPRTYFLAAPNPNARYSWVCPGPSRLDDSNSGACPESSTGGFRCCIDAATGGAVTDEMCCPEEQKQLRQRREGPSVTSLTQRIEGVLGKIVTRLEKEAIPPPQPRPTQYLAGNDAVKDINSYFNSLSPKPESHRSMDALEAKKDLNGFFTELGKGQLAGLASKPSLLKKQELPKPTAQDQEEMYEFAHKLATKLRKHLGHKDQEMARERFEDWKTESTGGNSRRGVMQKFQHEEVQQQLRAEQKGEQGAREWASGEHYFTDVRGPTTVGFKRRYHPIRSEGLEAEQHSIVVPDTLVKH